ncbi:MAG: ABC transporter permease [Paludibacter sp.]|jgi:putative ABC transport system permease protein|nr:ABC transporter permease [Paludibacter sp.]
MFDLDRFQEIWITITHNKSRSVLTAFGVFWGMFMLVAMVGAGVALERGISSQVEGFATNSCFIWENRTSEPYKGFRKGRQWEMRNRDITLLQKTVTEIQYIAPVIFGGRGENNVLRDDKSGSFGVKGNFPSYNDIDNQKLITGRYINEIDIAEKRKVCVIGERVYEVMFPQNEDPLGKTIQVNGIYFTVIGVTRSTTNINIGGDSQETVVLPFSTMQQAFNMGDRVHFLAITAQPGVKVKVVEDKVKTVLKQAHDISPEDKIAVGGMNIEDQFTMFLYLGIGIASLIWIVGTGTLLAGAVGVSNIMLVTVKERTREIGIRRALGATPSNIVGQILTESVVLTLLAGVSGLMVGVGLLSLVGKVLEQADGMFKDPQISFGVGVGALIILVVIGTLAGFIPANRAMKIKPIEAIREE